MAERLEEFQKRLGAMFDAAYGANVYSPPNPARLMELMTEEVKKLQDDWTLIQDVLEEFDAMDELEARYEEMERRVTV